MPLTPAAWSFSCWNGSQQGAKGNAGGDGTYVCDSGKRVDHVCVVQWRDSCRIVASNIVSDVGEQLGEVCDFEDLIECEELQGGNSSALQTCGERRVRE